MRRPLPGDHSNFKRLQILTVEPKNFNEILAGIKQCFSLGYCTLWLTFETPEFDGVVGPNEYAVCWWDSDLDDVPKYLEALAMLGFTKISSYEAATGLISRGLGTSSRPGSLK